MSRYGSRYAGSGGVGGGIGTIDDTNVPAWVPAVLTYDAIEEDYIPTAAKALDRPKEFRGPIDPDTVTGVVLNTYDAWIETAP